MLLLEREMPSTLWYVQLHKMHSVLLSFIIKAVVVNFQFIIIILQNVYFIAIKSYSYKIIQYQQTLVYKKYPVHILNDSSYTGRLEICKWKHKTVKKQVKLQ